MYSENELLTQLCELANDIGHPPSRSDVADADDVAPVSAFCAQFHSFKRAKEAAGLAYDYTTDGLVAALRDRADELGHSPRKRDMDDTGRYPSSQVYGHWFEGWGGALEAAGLEVYRGDGREYTDQKLIGQLNGLANELGHYPSQTEVNAAEDTPSVTTYQRRFGSLKAATEEVDLSPTKTQEHTNEGLLEELQGLADELGHPPAAAELTNAEGCPSVRTYRERFGTWIDTLEAAGLETHRTTDARKTANEG